MRLKLLVVVGLILSAVTSGLHAESKSENLIECPGFEEEKNSVTERKYPLGLRWRERSKGGLCQEVGAAKGNDSEVALELHKDEGQGTNHRIVNQLAGVTLKAGVEYLLQFDFWSGEEFPARDCGVQIGISSTGGEGRPEWGTNDYIPGGFTVLNVNTIE